MILTLQRKNLSLYELEEKYRREFQKKSEWVYLRNYYRLPLMKIQASKLSFFQKIRRHVTRYGNITYGFNKWFRSYNTLMFSNVADRRIIDDVFFCVSLDSIADYLGVDDVLFIENPARLNHKKSSQCYSKHVVSRILPDTVVKIVHMFFSAKKCLFLEKVNLEIGIEIPYQKIVKKNLAGTMIYSFLFRFLKPNLIIVSCYYDKQYIIKAAKMHNIKVVEIQHGLISSENYAYNTPLNLDGSYIPDILWKIFNFNEDQCNIYCRENMFYLGSFYLEHLHQTFDVLPSLQKLTLQYRCVVCVSLQGEGNIPLKRKTLSFLEKVARVLPDVLFLLVDKFDSLEPLTLDNLIYSSYDVYTTILHSDFHSTVYSACAIEAPILGIKNILLNIDGLSVKYLGEEYIENSHIVNEATEMIEILKNHTSDNNFNGHSKMKYVYSENLDRLSRTIWKNSV